MKTQIILRTILLLLVGHIYGQQLTESDQDSNIEFDRKQWIQDAPPLEERPFQISFIPGLGTNGLDGGNFTNQLSLNILGGYNGGVNGLEMGGFLNIDRWDVNGVQLSGFANVVMGETNGTQLAGFANINLQEVNGVQMAGFLNYAKESDIQLAGFANYTWENSVQISGYSNFARRSKTQIAGFGNSAWEQVDGVQISGFLNYAKSVNGFQIGVINVAEKIENGAPIGILNFIKEGMHRIEIDHNDLTDINFSYKSGISQFYSVVTTGVSTSNNIWSYGFGLGSEIPIKESLYTDVEFSVHNIQSTDHYIEGHSDDYRLNWSVGYKISKDFSVNAGPVIHYYFFNPSKTVDSTFPDQFGQHALYENGSNGKLHRVWVGYRIAITIL